MINSHIGRQMYHVLICKRYDNSEINSERKSKKEFILDHYCSGINGCYVVGYLQ